MYTVCSQEWVIMKKYIYTVCSQEWVIFLCVVEIGKAWTLGVQHCCKRLVHCCNWMLQKDY